MSISVVLADANVLIPRTLRDYIVYLGKAGAYQLHWSQSILDEMSRNLVAKYGFSSDDATELELRLTEYLPRALVEARDRDIRKAEKTSMDAKDRHVLAAALAAEASIIVTDNDRHFPRSSMARHGIEVLRAGDLLTRIAVAAPDALQWAHRVTVANSPKTESAILATLGRAVGQSAALAVRAVVAPEMATSGRLSGERGERFVAPKRLSPWETLFP